MTHRPIDEPTGGIDLPDEAPPNPETDTVGQPQPDRDQPAEVEPVDVAEDPSDPGEDPGVDPPKETDELLQDPTRVAETEDAEEPAGGTAAKEAETGQMPDHDTEVGA